jgi:hypothetical protein
MASWEHYLKKIHYDSSNPTRFVGKEEKIQDKEMATTTETI